MKSKSNKAFKINSRDEKRLFKDAVIVYDSSALLDFYGYSEKAKNEIFDLVFAKLEGRLWIPAQVEYEFTKNRESVITKPINSYQNLIYKTDTKKEGGFIEAIESSISNFKNKDVLKIRGNLKALIERTIKDNKHPHINQKSLNDLKEAVNQISKDLDKLEKIVKTSKQIIQAEIKVKERKIKTIKGKDSLLVKLNQAFTIGDEYKYEELIEIVKEGKFRYENKIPPGYEDEGDKIGFQVYGDLILWKQTMEYAKRISKPIILITNDFKDDWWQPKSNNEIPRHELIIEFIDKTNQQFWMYSGESFLHKANLYFKANVNKSTIQELLDFNSEKFRKIEEEWLELLEEAIYDGEDVMANHNYKFKGKNLGSWLSNVSQDNKLGKKLALLKEIEEIGFDFKQRGHNPDLQAKRFIQRLVENEELNKMVCQNYFNSVLMDKQDRILPETKRELNTAWKLRFNEERLWEKQSQIKDKTDEWKKFRYNKDLNPKEKWSTSEKNMGGLYHWVRYRKKRVDLLELIIHKFSKEEIDELREQGFPVDEIQ